MVKGVIFMTTLNGRLQSRRLAQHSAAKGENS
jgi:hypothetical protein